MEKLHDQSWPLAHNITYIMALSDSKSDYLPSINSEYYINNKSILIL